MRAWVMLGAVSLVYLLNAGFPYYGAGVLNAMMVEQQGIARSVLGLGFTVMLLVQGLGGPGISWAMSRLGMRATFTLGSVLIAIGALLMATVVNGTWSYLLVFGLVIGIGTGLSTYIPSQTLIAQWFDRHRSLAFSIAMGAGGLGGFVVAPLLGYQMQANGGDWRAGWVLGAGCALAMGVLSWAVIRTRTVPSAPASSSTTTVANTAEHWSAGRLFSTPLLWIVILGDLAVGMPIMGMVAHGIAHLRAGGLSAAEAAAAIGIMSLAGVGGKVLAGALGDHMDPRHLWSASLVAIGVGMGIAVFGGGAVGLYVFPFVLGIGYGAGLVCKSSLISRYFGPGPFGLVMGTMAPVSIGLTALSPYLIGLAWDWTGSYASSFAALCLLSITAAVALQFARPPKTDGSEPG